MGRDQITIQIPSGLNDTLVQGSPAPQSGEVRGTKVPAHVLNINDKTDPIPNHILVDFTTGDFVPLHRMVEGDSYTGRNGHAVFMAKNATGNARIPLVDANDHLVISLESGDTANIGDEGSNTGSTSIVDVITIPTLANKVYRNLSYMGSSFRDTVFTLVAIEDVGGSPVETELFQFRVGSANNTEAENLPEFQYTAGSTGVQTLVLRGQNTQSPSNMSGRIDIKEVQ